MKYVLSLCIFSAFFMNLAHCDCTTTCTNSLQSAVRGVRSQDQICPLIRTYLNCLEETCKVELSSYYPLLEKLMKDNGVSCSLNAASRSVSLSLLTVCGSVLLTAYRIFSM
ncbi:uncharacterized protein LOC112574197 isoform X2 [Pomacea canaliculata]|uniref:uncharacterized protein LOC112574197 isoform X2 n=1 Tax=Pomacea canaliculata TaxID=400727 RepID=UPI000D736ECD|nr:uncharacterized protein LOC112574197 isoform X2 [Pomacea canaliculata]